MTGFRLSLEKRSEGSKKKGKRIQKIKQRGPDHSRKRGQKRYQNDTFFSDYVGKNYRQEKLQINGRRERNTTKEERDWERVIGNHSFPEGHPKNKTGSWEEEGSIGPSRRGKGRGTAFRKGFNPTLTVWG